VIVSDLWAAYPEALAAVWPRAQRQPCWFHVMQRVTRQLARLLKHYEQTLPEADRKELNRLRFLLLASPEKQQRLGPRAQAASGQCCSNCSTVRGLQRDPPGLGAQCWARTVPPHAPWPQRSGG
jgi:hypothetical protein